MVVEGLEAMAGSYWAGLPTRGAAQPNGTTCRRPGRHVSLELDSTRASCILAFLKILHAVYYAHLLVLEQRLHARGRIAKDSDQRNTILFGLVFGNAPFRAKASLV